MDKSFYNVNIGWRVFKKFVRIIRNNLQKLFILKRRKIKRMLIRDLLSNYTQKIHQDSLLIQYQNIYKENELFIKEITQSLSEVISFKDDSSHAQYIQKFETLFADYHNIPYAIGVSSGTTALVYALIALGVGPGDEVITTAHTCVSTVLAITDVGAKPVFVDINDSFNIAPEKIEEKITLKTKAIIPTHLHGMACEIEKIIVLAQKHGIEVIEDACQALGTHISGKKVGTFGKIGCFSFHPSKIVAGLGDGGIIITADSRIAETVAKLRDPEIMVSAYQDREFLKSHRTPAGLDVIHIPFLAVKLKNLERIINKREQIVALYSEMLKNITQVVLPEEKEQVRSCHRSYTLQTENRDGLFEHLFAVGIRAKISYSNPLHLRPVFGYLGYVKGDLPACERISKKVISLPISHALSLQEVESVAKEVKKFYKNR